MMNKLLKMIACACMFISLAFLVHTDTFAKELYEINLQEKGSITLQLEDATLKHKISDGTFALFQIASIDEQSSQLTYHYTNDFINNGMNLDDLNAEGFATHLADYANSQHLVGNIQEISAAGTVIWDDLDLGLYLVVQTESSKGYYHLTPFLIAVPMSQGTDVIWTYDIVATPKLEPTPILPSENELTVTKVWIDSGENTPEQIEVQLFRNHEVFETVILNAANHWKYTWEGLSEAYQWTVKEKEVPEGYKVTYSYQEMEIMITNTSTSERPPLIQTGQLNWPIPVLAGMGIICFAAGWYITYMKKEKDNEE